MVGTDSKSNLPWLNAPDRSFALKYCTDKCTENHRVKPGHCWDDEDELVACVYCRTDFHADCVVRAPLVAYRVCSCVSHALWLTCTSPLGS